MIGGTRRDWRGRGHFRALTERQEVWAIERASAKSSSDQEQVYEMRGTLDHLRSRS
jgi:hypothetical protein